MAVRSPTSSSKKIRSALLLKGTVASTATVERRLADEFGLKAYKPAKKPRLESQKICVCKSSPALDYRKLEKSFVF